LSAAVLALVLTGCADAEGEPLARWRLVSSEGGPIIELPATLASPTRDDAFVLERRWTPPQAEPAGFDLVMLGVQAKVSLEVDGVRAAVLRDGAGIAPPGPRTVVPQRFHIPASDRPGPRILRLRIENSWYQAGWIEGVPRVVEAGVMVRKENIALVTNLYASFLSVGVAIQVGAMFLAVFLFGGRRTAYMWFGVQALTTTVLPLYLLGYTQAAFGAFEGGVFGALLAVGNTVGVRFSHEFFELKPPHWGLWVVSAAGIIIPMSLAGPFTFTPYGAPAINTLISLHVGYQILLCVRLWRSRGPDLRVALFGICWTTLSVVSTADQLAWWGVPSALEGARLASLGIAAFAFLQSILVASHYRGSLDAADSLNQELREKLEDLAQRKTEVDMLNTELRAQVQERSQQMFLALSLAASRGAAPVLAEGQSVHGRYQVLGRIGKGGMADVYRVRRKRDGRLLALKVTHNVDGVSLARLAREATMIASIAHRHVVELVDVDVAPEGFAYLTMEIVEGLTLGEIDVSKRSKEFCLDVLDQVLDGLSALHSLGIVHRDLKPANVVVTEDGGRPQVKLIDFGISRRPEELTARVVRPVEQSRQLADAFAALPDETLTMDPQPKTPSTTHSTSLTRDGLLAGTPAYMAPELAQGDAAASEASDVFALGVMVYQVLTGRPPFVEPLIIRALRSEDLPTPSALQVPWMAAGLREEIQRCLSHAPEGRPTTSELRNVIARARDSAPRPERCA
jgi:hypothetical protein